MPGQPTKEVLPEKGVHLSKLDKSLDETAGDRKKIAKKRRNDDSEESGVADSELVKRPRLEHVRMSEVGKDIRGGITRSLFLKDDPDNRNFVAHTNMTTLAVVDNPVSYRQLTGDILERNMTESNGKMTPMMVTATKITKRDMKRVQARAKMSIKGHGLIQGPQNTEASSADGQPPGTAQPAPAEEDAQPASEEADTQPVSRPGNPATGVNREPYRQRRGRGNKKYQKPQVPKKNKEELDVEMVDYFKNGPVKQ